jgi:ATP synthase I subunit
MTVRELATGVTRQATILVLVATLAGGWLGGARGALGVLTGGALGIAAFLVLAARVRALSAAGPTLTAPWLVLAGLRFAAVSGVAALLFVAGWAHPVAWLAGYSVLPIALVVQGLRLAREESRSWT